MFKAMLKHTVGEPICIFQDLNLAHASVFAESYAMKNNYKEIYIVDSKNTNLIVSEQVGPRLQRCHWQKP